MLGVWSWPYSCRQSTRGDGVPETGNPYEITQYQFYGISHPGEDDYPSIVFALSCLVGYPEVNAFGNLGIDMLTNPVHSRNSVDDHSRMLTTQELMILSRWVDSNYQFYGSYYGRRHANWVQPDAKIPSYDPADFRRKPTFAEAINALAPTWHK